MNNKGQSIFMGVIFAIMIFMAGMLIVNFIELEADSLLGTTGLDCDDPSISDGTKVTCLIGELIVPYFILIFLSGAGGVLAARFLT